MVTITPEEQARSIAQENREGDEGFQKAYWLPDEGELRLIVVSTDVPKEADGKVHPFYFSPDRKRGLPLPFAVALMRPEEFEKAELPDGWGNWSSFKVLTLQ